MCWATSDCRLERYCQGLPYDIGEDLAEVVSQARAVARVDPGVPIKLVMKTARRSRDPHFLERRLAVDHNVSLLIEHQCQHLAAAAGIKIDIQIFKPAVGLLMNVVKDGICPCKKF